MFIIWIMYAAFNYSKQKKTKKPSEAKIAPHLHFLKAVEIFCLKMTKTKLLFCPDCWRLSEEKTQNCHDVLIYVRHQAAVVTKNH